MRTSSNLSRYFAYAPCSRWLSGWISLAASRWRKRECSLEGDNCKAQRAMSHRNSRPRCYRRDSWRTRGDSGWSRACHRASGSRFARAWSPHSRAWAVYLAWQWRIFLAPPEYSWTKLKALILWLASRQICTPSVSGALRDLRSQKKTCVCDI